MMRHAVLLGLVSGLALACAAEARITAAEAALWNTHTYGIFQSGKQASMGH